MDETIVINKEERSGKSSISSDIELDATRVVASQSTVVLSSKKQDSPETNNFVDSKKDKVQVEVGDCIKSRFDLMEVVGVGGMGVVYRARDRRQKELGDQEPYLAFKVLNDQLLNNEAALVALQRECKRTQKLAHPNIVNVYDFDRDGEIVFITMELLHGRSLDQVIADQRFKVKRYDQVIPWVSQMCDALIYAHSHGIVHSDFKPSNVFVTESESLKVFDFGIARATQSKKTSSEELSALTPAYASLGMLKSKPPKGSDDLYALAIVVYMLLTGKHPYRKKSALKVMEQRLVPVKPEGLPDKAWRCLRQALDPVDCEALTVQQFREAFVVKKVALSQRLVVPMVVTISVTLIAVGFLAVRWYEDRAYSDVLSNGSLVEVIETLDLINSLGQSRRENLIIKSREGMIRNALEAIDSKIQTGDMLVAKEHCELTLGLFKDSKVLVEKLRHVNQKILETESTIEKQLLDLEFGLLDFDREEITNWYALLDKLKRVSKEHELLEPQRLSSTLSTLVHSLLYRNSIEPALMAVSLAEKNRSLNISLDSTKEKLQNYQSNRKQGVEFSAATREGDSLTLPVALVSKIRALSHSTEFSFDIGMEILSELSQSKESYSRDVRASLKRYLLRQIEASDTALEVKKYKQWLKALN